MKEWIMNTSWSCTPKVSFKELQVGCDVPAYVTIAKAVNVQLTKADSVNCR